MNKSAPDQQLLQVTLQFQNPKFYGIVEMTVIEEYQRRLGWLQHGYKMKKTSNFD